MALADTARLIATLELQDKFSATASKYDRTIAGMQRQTSTLGQIGGQVSQGIGTAIGNLTRLGVVGVGILGVQVAQGIQSLQRLEEVTVATNAVIESTGGVAGVTAEQVRSLAEEYESLNATMDDKVIQSAENVLLTFTSIGEKVFPQALEAALNMNQALGGGEEGLQGTVIQLGKALQDPIRGLTALRRVGVNFTRAQQDQIRALVESNRLYEAQQIILSELGTEFGGQFAAAGDTATARFAKFKDAVEDAQMALATAFIPVLEKVADKLTTLLADPATMAALEELGTNLADAFDELVDVAGNLPWESIGNAFKLMGTGSKALLDAFTGLPPWVQTAVLTGWGLNKLTGGALSSIVGTLASGLVRGVLGINAGVVNLNAGTVTGAGGAPVAGGGAAGGGIITKLLGVGSAVVLGGLIGNAIGKNVFFDPTVTPAINFESSRLEALLARGDPAALQRGIDAVNSGLDDIASGGAIVQLLAGDQVTLLEQQLAVLKERLAQVTQSGKDTQARLREGQSIEQRQTEQLTRNLEAVNRANNERRADAIRQLQEQSAANVKLQQIANKNFSPTVRVNVVSNVTISEIQRKITSMQIAVGTGPLEF